MLKNKFGKTQITKGEIESAIRTILTWIGDNPNREGLQLTPSRVLKSYEEIFSGYNQDPSKVLEKTFKEVENYDDIIFLKDILLRSTCEHHMLPIVGKAHIAYIPNKKIIGISKLARVVDIYARRLQVQEKLTAQIGNTIQECLQPKGVAVMIKAEHACMTLRGVNKPGSIMNTYHFTGIFNKDPMLKDRIMRECSGHT